MASDTPSNRPIGERNADYTQQSPITFPSLGGPPKKPKNVQHHIPGLLNGAGARETNQITRALTRGMAEAQRRVELEAKIFGDIAKAIDEAISKYDTAMEHQIADRASKAVIDALLAQFRGKSVRPSNPAVEVKETYARKAAWQGDKMATKGATAKPAIPAKGQGRNVTTESREDSRVLVRLLPERQLNRDQPYVLRSMLATRIKGITLVNVPDITPTRTGWAIVSADLSIRDKLLANKETVLDVLGGVEATISEDWYTYYIPNVPTAFNGPQGAILITEKMVRDEVLAKTGVTPCRAEQAKTGAHIAAYGGYEDRMEATWIVSFTRRVDTFHVFDLRCQARLKLKKMPLRIHAEGCLGWCNPAKCTRIKRCMNCGREATKHTGPMGEGCEQAECCANCHGPFRSGHENCPAAPTRKGDGLVKQTSRQLSAIRRASHKLAKRVQEIITPTPGSSRHGTPQTASSASEGAPIDADTSPQREKSPTPVSNKRKIPGATPGAIIAAYEARGTVRATPASTIIPETPLNTQRGRRGAAPEAGSLNVKALSDNQRKYREKLVNTNRFSSIAPETRSSADYFSCDEMDESGLEQSYSGTQ